MRPEGAHRLDRSLSTSATILYQLYSTGIKIMHRRRCAKWADFTALIRRAAGSAQAAEMHYSDSCARRSRAYTCAAQPMSKSVVRNHTGADAGTKPLAHPLAPLLAHQRICGEACQTSIACCLSLTYICPGLTLATDVVGRHQLVLHRRHSVPQCAPHCASTLH